jgi:hypothetical protein
VACAVTLYWELHMYGFFHSAGESSCPPFPGIVSAIAEQLSSSMHGRLLRGFA